MRNSLVFLVIGGRGGGRGGLLDGIKGARGGGRGGLLDAIKGKLYCRIYSFAMFLVLQLLFHLDAFFCDIGGRGGGRGGRGGLLDGIKGSYGLGRNEVVSDEILVAQFY